MHSDLVQNVMCHHSHPATWKIITEIVVMVGLPQRMVLVLAIERTGVQ